MAVKSTVNGSWLRNKERYICGSDYTVAGIVLGTTRYDSCTTKDDPKKYAAGCKLPGIKSRLGHFEKEQDAKDMVIKAINYWFAKISSAKKRGRG